MKFSQPKPVYQFFGALVFALLLLATGGCLPSPPESKSGRTLTLYGFSIMKEPLEKEIFPAFAAKWKAEHGEEISFSSSFAGSEVVTNQILQGTPADLAVLSIERDVDRLIEGKAITQNLSDLPHGGIVNRTPFVILVRRGNPKNIRDFPDLAKRGVKLIHPDPVSSGGAQWSILSIYGAELKKSEAATGAPDALRAAEMLGAIWKNVIATPSSAREARTQFETGFGDALVTYELEGLMMRQAGAPIEIVMPKATIFSEHPAVVIDRNLDQAKRPLAEAFLKFLWSDEAQKAFVKHHFRSVTDETLNDEHREFGTIEQPFTIDYFGGWKRAHPEVIEKVFRQQAVKDRR